MRAGRPRRTFVVSIVASVAFAMLAALGTWQLQRRSWKLDLIERVDARVRAPAVAAPGPQDWPQLRTKDDEYRHVQVVGRFLEGADTLVQAVTERGPGFWVLTPLQRDDGSTVLVNRGFVPTEARSRIRPVAGRVTVSGLLRVSEPGGGFLRHNAAAADRWYSRDVAAIAAARGLARVAPFFVDADATPAADGADGVVPVGGLTVVAFSNNHLVYAITWYTLALMVAAAGWRWAREERPADAD